MRQNNILLPTFLFSLLLISSHARTPFNIKMDIPKPESTELSILSDTLQSESTETTIVSDTFQPGSAETTVVSDVSILPSSEYNSLAGPETLEVPEIETDTTTVFPDVISIPTFLRLRPTNPHFRPVHHHHDHRRPPFWLRLFHHRPCQHHHHDREHQRHDHEHHGHGGFVSGRHFPGKRFDWVNGDVLTHENFDHHMANEIIDLSDNTDINQEMFEHMVNNDWLTQQSQGYRHVDSRGRPLTNIDFDSKKREISYGNDMVIGDHESNDHTSIPRVMVRRVDNDEMKLFRRLEHEELMPEREEGDEGGIFDWVQKFLNGH